MIAAPWGPALAVALALAGWWVVLRLGRRGGAWPAGVVVVVLALLMAGWHVDDAGIVYAYSRALAAGAGLVPGAGLAPVEGFSDPLWVALLAFFTSLGVPPPVAATGAQLALAVATVGLVYRIACGADRSAGTLRRVVEPKVAAPDSAPSERSAHSIGSHERMIDDAPWVSRSEGGAPRRTPSHEGSGLRGASDGRLEASITAMAVATSGVWIVWASSGLEVALYGAILVAIGALASAGTLPPDAQVGERGGAPPRSWSASVGRVALGALVAAGWWVRPEGGVAALAVVLLGAWLGRRRVGLAPWVGFVTGLAALLVIRWLWLGAMLPNTAVAKLSGWSMWIALRGLAYAAWAGGLAGWWFVVVAAVPVVRRGRARSLWAAVGVMAVGSVFATASGGDWMGHGRLVAPYTPLAFAWAIPWVVARRSRVWGGAGVLAVVGVGVTVLAHAIAWPTLPMDHGLRRGELYLHVGTSSCGRAAVATPDIGGVLYGWPEVEVLDLVGLVDAEAASHRGRPDYWAARIAVERPPVVDLHGRWAERVALPDPRLEAQDYRILCRRGERVTAPTLWVDARCPEPLSERAEQLVATWCAKGSGVPWP